MHLVGFTIEIYYDARPYQRQILHSISFDAVLVGPCHHGMARPQVADRGTASDKEGSCE